MAKTVINESPPPASDGIIMSALPLFELRTTSIAGPTNVLLLNVCADVVSTELVFFTIVVPSAAKPSTLGCVLSVFTLVSANLTAVRVFDTTPMVVAPTVPTIWRSPACKVCWAVLPHIWSTARVPVSVSAACVGDAVVRKSWSISKLIFTADRAPLVIVRVFAAELIVLPLNVCVSVVPTTAPAGAAFTAVTALVPFP